MSETGGASASPSSQRRGGATASGLARRGGQLGRNDFAGLPLRLRPIGLALCALLCEEGNARRATVLFFVIILAITLPLLTAAPGALRRIVAICDIHGALDASSVSLQRTHPAS